MISQSSVCPMCGNAAKPAFVAHDRNRQVTRERFTYHRCMLCKTVFLPDIPSDLGQYYRVGYEPFDDDGEPQWKSNPSRQLADLFRVQMLRTHVKGGALIDIGAGSGGFVAAAQSGGFDVTAVEMDARCCAYIEERLGASAVCSDNPLEALSALAPSNAIVLWHAFEHLLNPVATLEGAIEKLEPGGVLAIAVPNPRSLQFRWMRTRWAHLDAPRHLVLAPPEVLMEKARSYGMTCVEATTTDPNGVECDLLGWINAIRPNPARGPSSRFMQLSAFALCHLAAPIERRGLNGSAVTLVFRKGMTA